MGFTLLQNGINLHKFDETAEPFATIKQFTNDPIGRLYVKRTLAAEVFERQIEGDIVSCGACNGGTAALLAHTALTRGRHRHTWLFDSFEGMPEPSAEDSAEAWTESGTRGGSIDQCRSAMHSMGITDTDFSVVPGWFEQTYSTHHIHSISILHIDVGQYDAELLSLKEFYNRVEPGGLILLDDYGQWPGCKKAIDSFFSSFKKPPQITQIDDASFYLFKQHTPYHALNDRS